MEGLFQPMHLLVILVIALFVFGPKRLPELGKGLGDGLRALKDGLREQPPRGIGMSAAAGSVPPSTIRVSTMPSSRRVWAGMPKALSRIRKISVRQSSGPLQQSNAASRRSLML